MDLKKDIELKLIELQTVRGEYNALRWKCAKAGHKIIKRSLSAICNVCKEHLGWWCPDSTDHLCHYPTKEERELDHTLYYEMCVFCGHPSERK